MTKKIIVWLLLLVHAGSAVAAPLINMDLKTALKAGVPVVVKIGADWCHPCKAMKPVLKELAAEQKGKMIFLDLDINENRELAKKFQVMLIPTILFYDKHGKFKYKFTGFMSKADILKTIREQRLDR